MNRLDPSGLADTTVYVTDTLTLLDLQPAIMFPGQTSAGGGWGTAAYFNGAIAGAISSAENYIQTFAGPGNITVAGYSRTGPQEATISNDLTTIQNQVLTGDCAKWLTGADFSAADVIGAMMTAVSGGPSFGYGALNSNTTAAFVGNVNTNGTPVAGLPADASITVNSNGAFFNGGYSVGSGNTQYAGGTLKAQLFILVHELAHLVGAGGFLPDAGNAANGASNDRLVQQNCGKQIAGVH